MGPQLHPIPIIQNSWQVGHRCALILVRNDGLYSNFVFISLDVHAKYFDLIMSVSLPLFFFFLLSFCAVFGLHRIVSAIHMIGTNPPMGKKYFSIPNACAVSLKAGTRWSLDRCWKQSITISCLTTLLCSLSDACCR